MEFVPTESKTNKHYLEQELDALFARDSRMWEFLQQRSLDGVWYWNLENPEDEWISPEFWALLGLNPDDMPHSPDAWQGLIDPEDLKVALGNFTKHCEDPSHPYDQIVRYRHANGSTVWVRCRGIAIRDNAGKPVRMLGAHNDLTAVKATEAELAELHEQANNDLRRFAYGISHDLKSPANTTKMLLSEIRQSDTGGLNDEQRELLGFADETIDRMCDLLENFLSYAGFLNLSPAYETVNTDQMVADILADQRANLQSHAGTVKVGALPTVRGNPLQLRSLFQNLIENALKYCARGRSPDVRISGREDPDGFRFEISDNGIGIEAKFHKKIFELFVRLHNRDEYPGSGMGLATCSRVVTNHGGKLWVDSELGAGSTFFIFLPKGTIQ